MKTNSVLLRKMFPQKDKIGNDSIFPVSDVFSNLESYYKSIMNMLSLRKSAMINVQEDVYKQFDIEANELANNQPDADKHEFKFAYKQHLLDTYIDDIINFDVHYPQYFRRFFLTQLYSFIESEMKFICEFINENKKYLPNMKYLSSRQKNAKVEKNSFFDSYFNYLSEFENISRIDFVEELEHLDKMRAVRNCITHNMSIISKQNPNFVDIEKLSHKDTGIRLAALENSADEYEIQLVDDTIIEATIKTATSFFNKLLEERRNEFFNFIID